MPHALVESTDKNELNCGNWAYKLNKEKQILIQQVYPKWKNKEDENKPLCKVKFYKFKDLKFNFEKVEAIFLAQSPAWVPPHFDKDFVKLVTEVEFACSKGIDFNKPIIVRKLTSKTRAKNLLSQFKQTLGKIRKLQMANSAVLL